MFGTLLESNRSRQWRIAGATASVAAHTAIIGVAVVTGASATTRLPTEAKDPPPEIVWRIPARVAPLVEQSSSPAGGAHVIVDRGPAPAIPLIVYDGGQTRTPIVLERDLIGGLRADTGPAGCLGHCREGLWAEPKPIDGEPGTILTVDRAALLVAPPRPRYPEQLRAAGVTGRVVARFVVDTLGRVEPGTVVIRESSHDLFAQAVRPTLPRLSFVPAEARGRRVRMLVDLPFEFRLNQ